MQICLAWSEVYFFAIKPLVNRILNMLICAISIFSAGTPTKMFGITTYKATGMNNTLLCVAPEEHSDSKASL